MRLAWLVAVLSVAPVAQAQIARDKLVDLSWPFDEQTIYWPTAKSFHWSKDAWGTKPGGYFYSSASFAASEHGGTHLDAPLHFNQQGAAVDALPLARLVGPALVVDVAAACAKDPDHRVGADELTAWEKAHGRIAERAIVLVRTGWGRHWPDKKRYLGSDVPGDAAHLHFPGLSRAAAELLVARTVDGVGIDTASLDAGPSTDFIVHRVLMAAGIYGLENVAALERLPPTGATLIALPMKIKGGTGGPTRIIALLP
jgi:kynurenine formamidase